MKKHFINNLIFQLNCISRVSAMENAQETQKLINKMIDSMRYKTSRENHIVRVKKELKEVNNFLEMFMVRFGDVFKYDIDVEQACFDAYIPHFTIMTFVENGVYHAFENKEGLWEININIRKTKEGFQILIRDNGIGFDPALYTKRSVDYAEYGTISSTLRRLTEYTKKENVVKFESSNEEGTSVIINIPNLNEETLYNV